MKPEAQARTVRDLRSAGWQAFFGPPRACGFGEMILVHRRYSACSLQDSDQLCSVALRLAGGDLARIASVYAPIKKRGTQEAFFGELAMWQDKPGFWFSGGDFNSNLLDSHPCSGHFGHTTLGTWRSSVKHSWCNPIDGFVGCGNLKPANIVGLHDEVTSQHAPVICDVPGKLHAEDRLAWALPRPVSRPWSASDDAAFHDAIARNDSQAAWNTWLDCALGLTGHEPPYRTAKGAVVAKDADAVLALMNRLRRLSAEASATGWTPQKHAQYEATEVELTSSLNERRRSAIAAWKIRMRDLAKASKWVKQGPTKALSLLREDGSPALTPTEQGQAVRREWLPFWTEASPAQVHEQVQAAVSFSEVVASKATPFSGLPEWTTQDIRAQVRSTAAGLDGISFHHIGDLEDVHLQRLAALFNAFDKGLPFPTSWNNARLICIAKDDGSARPLSILHTVYRMWAARTVKHLSEWCSWFPDELVGGRSGGPPAVVTGNEVSSWLAAAHGDGTFLAGASLDTRKCFDSVSLPSLRALLHSAGAPLCMFNVLNIWESLTRHIWTVDGPTGVTIKATVQKGLPQGDPLAPWALNLVMAAWVWCLPRLDLLRVFLDDRCLLHKDVGTLASALRCTTAFDAAFGLSIHPLKSCRFFVGPAPDDGSAAEWRRLPLKESVKYLGVMLETAPGADCALGDHRATVVRSKMLRARLLPNPEVRRGLLAAYLQGLYAEGTPVSQLVIDKLRTAVVQAWWGPTMHPHNYMRSTALTLGLLAPLHRMDPSMIQCYSAIVALARLSARSLPVVRALWRACSRLGSKCVGFARLVRHALMLLGWSWPDWEHVCPREDCSVRLTDLARKDRVGQTARHVLRNELRSWWWSHWDGSRICHEGLSAGIDRRRTLQPLIELGGRRRTFGWDGSDLGARYARFLADALWSRHRLFKASKVADARCRRCGLDDEHTDHFLWACSANDAARRDLAAAWTAAMVPGGVPAAALPDCLPQCMRQTGVVTFNCGFADAQIQALQCYFVRVLREWAAHRQDAVEEQDAEGDPFQVFLSDEGD